MATIVGDTSLVKGHLEGDEDLTVRGRVEGSVNLTKTLIVEPSGIVKAEVSVRNCIVSGVVVGNITATDSVELTQEARVVGDLTAPRVIIVDGASFRGKVDMGDLGQRPAITPRPSTASRPAAMTRTAPAPTRSAPAPSRPAPAPSRPAPAVATASARPAPSRASAPARAPAKAPAKKAPAAPPKPPRASGKKKKVKVKKRR